MITINHCLNCGAQFLIPEEFGNGVDVTVFTCPECYSTKWEKLSDSPIVKNQLTTEGSKLIQ
jgi:protein-arginine kinase activator protein McsA